MAVPFNIPDDQNDCQVIILQLQTLLSRLQMVVRRNQQISQQQQQEQQQQTSTTTQTSSTSRVRSTSISRQRTRDTPETSITLNQNAIPELISHLSLLASSSGDPQSSSSCTAIPVRSPRPRANSESNCDVTKTTAIKQSFAQDWNKINCDDDKNKESSSDGLLSKIMPGTVSSCSLMTAMICFVGWHIFRAR